MAANAEIGKMTKAEITDKFQSRIFFSELEVGLLPLPRSERRLGPTLPRSRFVKIQNFLSNLKGNLGKSYRCWDSAGVGGTKSTGCGFAGIFTKKSGLASFSSNLDGLSTGKALVVPEEALVHLTKYIS